VAFVFHNADFTSVLFSLIVIARSVHPQDCHCEERVLFPS